MKSLKLKLLLVFVLLSFAVSLLVGGIIFFRFSSFIKGSIQTSLSHAADFVEHTLPYASFGAYVKAIIEDLKEQFGQFKTEE